MSFKDAHYYIETKKRPKFRHKNPPTKHRTPLLPKDCLYDPSQKVAMREDDDDVVHDNDDDVTEKEEWKTKA